MNRFMLFVLLIFLVSTGCAYQETLNSWNGVSESELVETLGAPFSVYDTENGKILKYSHSRIGGTTPTEYYCEVNFFLDNNNVVTRSIAEGNIGGCNRLIKGSPTN